MGKYSETLVGRKLSDVSSKLSDTIWRTKISRSNTTKVNGMEARMSVMERRMEILEERVNGTIKAINKLVKYAQSAKNNRGLI